jgi:hypothetical protein
MFERASTLDQTTRLLTAQHHWQRAGDANVAHLAHQLGTLEGYLEEKPKSRDRRVQCNRRDPAIDAVQLVTAKVLVRGRIGRPAQVSGKVPYGTNVHGLSLGRHFTHLHVFDHPTTQR